MQVKVLIIGGGLSGLHTAFELQKREVDFVLIEARDRLGGRIFSRNWNSSTYIFDQPGYDLGPAWFWPGQRRMESLVQELALGDSVFTQIGEGDALYEDAQGAVQRGVGGVSMAGSYRMQGGMNQIIRRIEEHIPAEKIQLNSEAVHIGYDHESISTTVLTDGEEQCIHSQSVIIAMPPRLAVTDLTFEPSLASNRVQELSGIATWMAGHAKVLAFYDQPFWRTQGLSGDAISHCGPLQEIHDASPDTEGPYALFGFIGVPVKQRHNQGDALRKASIDQLARLFGAAAKSPLGMYLKDWAFDEYTSTERDQVMLNEHVANHLTSVVEKEDWDERLIWSGTETASTSERNNGYLEGALEASFRTLDVYDERFKQS